MPPTAPRLRILSVGGNAVSAFLSWRLQATNACDVTLVWKSGFESVAQYGISFRSPLFGNERFKPRSVVRSPEDAAQSQRGAFDYVVLCVKALPDVYDIASVIESVVTPQHTCILINTSHSIGVESYIEQRFPKNVVLSLVSGAEIVQLGPAEFEHQSATELWVGPANMNSEIPASIQTDMAEALAMTLGSGQVDCKVSRNIQQQQFERMIGPIAFHTTSVIFETPNHTELIGLTGVRNLVDDLMDEIIKIAQTRGCTFPAGFKEKITEEMLTHKEANSVMYQDYSARRPMEVETYLGSPIKLAKLGSVAIPRLETIYAMLHHVNIANQKRPVASAPTEAAAQQNGTPQQMQRMNSAPPPRGQAGPLPMATGGPNGPAVRGRGNRAPSMNGPPPPGPRRGPSGQNGANLRIPQPFQQRSSFEGPDLDQFSHLYGGPDAAYADGGSPGGDLAMRERELMLRQKELALREREMSLRGGPGGGRSHRNRQRMPDYDDDDEDGDDYFDPTPYRGPPVDPDNVDMMSITSRRNRKQPSHGQVRHHSDPPRGSGGGYGRPPMKNRISSRGGHDGLSENMMDNPMMQFGDNRYGNVDRRVMGAGSRTNSLTAARLNELSQGPSPNGYPPMARRVSQSPGNPFVQSNGRGPPTQGYPPHGANGMGGGMNGMAPNGRPSPDMRQPTPRYPPGHGNSVAPQQVEQRAGVSNLYPPKSGPQVRSLTGSASASAGSGESGHGAPIDSETSAFSSQSSLPARAHIGVQ